MPLPSAPLTTFFVAMVLSVLVVAAHLGPVTAELLKGDITQDEELTLQFPCRHVHHLPDVRHQLEDWVERARRQLRQDR